jgi:uncharacterized ubiquitin-like protein YukD
MTPEEIEQKLTDWMVNFVEQPHPRLGQWAPCPYARQARVNKQIKIVHSDYQRLMATVEQQLPELEHKEVVVICFDHTKISAQDLEKLIKVYNQQVLMSRNYVILEDHPDAVELVNGVHMNFGHCGLLVIQRLDKLTTASEQLKSKGYYDTWSQSELDQVVTWRSQ